MAPVDASLQRGMIPVVLDRPRVFIFDMSASWLIRQKYGAVALLKLYSVSGDAKKGTLQVEILDPEVARFFVWAGLQTDAKAHGETLPIEQVDQLVGYWNYDDVMQRLLFAVNGTMATPQMLEGKAQADGDAAKPAASKAKPPANPGPTKVSTSTKRSASRAASSAGGRRSSGRRAR